MTTITTLESVQADFQQWRQNKENRRSRTPDDLRQKALALLDDHPSAQVQKALRVTHSMLRNWADEPALSTTTAPEPFEFVALPIESRPTSSTADELTLDVTQADGGHWRLQGTLSASQLSAFVTALSGGGQ